MRAEFQNETPIADTLIIVFASAGLAFGGKPVQEFRSTFLKMGDTESYEICWVFDTDNSWFASSVGSEEWVQFLDRANSYRRSIAIGESKGGFAAIALRPFLPNCSQVLALGPQYSVARPFIAFNKILNVSPNKAQDQCPIRTAPKARVDQHGSTAIFFGSEAWEDFIHASFFIQAGYKPSIVGGAHHSVAAKLKQEGRLLEFIQAFCSAEPESSLAAAQAVVEDLLVRRFSDRVLGVEAPAV